MTVNVNSGSNPCGPPSQFGFALSGPTNLVIVVEVCTNLSTFNWTPVSTNSLATGSSCFSDPQTINHPQAFYRFRAQ